MKPNALTAIDEKIFEVQFIKCMSCGTIGAFKQDHPELYRVILLSMNRVRADCTQSIWDEINSIRNQNINELITNS